MCFPIKYEDAFFSKTVRGEDGIHAVVAVSALDRTLVGFITARTSSVVEADAADLLAAETCSGQREVMYILTLGVAERFRRRGVAASLLHQLLQRVMVRAALLRLACPLSSRLS